MRIWWIGLTAAVLAACAATEATPEERRAAEERLLAPFLADREVGCGELLVELTGNFHSCVGQPAVDRTRHRVVREQGSGFVDMVWTNIAGAAEGALLLTIGDAVSATEVGAPARPRTRFRVVNQVRLRVYEDRRPLTLNATAGGTFVFVKEASTAPREVKAFTIADGVLRRP